MAAQRTCPANKWSKQSKQQKDFCPPSGASFNKQAACKRTPACLMEPGFFYGLGHVWV